jgi:hypothetical protein
MIFDIEIELSWLEKQPEWCGIMAKVKEINNQKNKLIHRFDQDPKEWIQKAINKCDDEIKFFENILLFWSRTYSKMESIPKIIDNQAKLSNNGAKILDLIEDLKAAYTYDCKLDLVLTETFIKLANEKGMNTDKMDKSLHDLRIIVRDYQKHMFKQLDSEVKKATNE